MTEIRGSCVSPNENTSLLLTDALKNPVSGAMSVSPKNKRSDFGNSSTKLAYLINFIIHFFDCLILHSLIN